MGNKNISKVKLENFTSIGNNLVLVDSAPDKDKEAVQAEKANMKLLNKHNKECKDSSLIDDCLISHCFLRALEKQARQEIIKEMSLFFVKANAELFKQGAPPGCFYILRQGTCDIIVNGEKKILCKKVHISEILLYYMELAENILYVLQLIVMFGSWKKKF